MTNGDAPISVALVEDDVRVCRTLAMILSRAGDCRCVGQYHTGEDAVSAIPRIKPRVIFMDVNLPGISGIECVRQLVAKGVESQILMLTVRKDTEAIFEALTAGAVGYLVKPVPAEQLLAAVRDVYGGGAPMTLSIARKVVQSFQQKAKQAPPLCNLTPREQEILELLSQGFMYKEIANQLATSYATVRTHIEHIYKKLHVNSRSQAVSKIFPR